MAAKSKHGLNADQTKVLSGPSSLLGVASPLGSPRLARAFQKLIGGSSVVSATSYIDTFMATLAELGFVVGSSSASLTHPLAFERELALPVLKPSEAGEPVGAALHFALSQLPELEFYLPYISLRVRLAKAARGSGSPALTPEPDYDADGFLLAQ